MDLQRNSLELAAEAGLWWVTGNFFKTVITRDKSTPRLSSLTCAKFCPQFSPRQLLTPHYQVSALCCTSYTTNYSTQFAKDRLPPIFYEWGERTLMIDSLIQKSVLRELRL